MYESAPSGKLPTPPVDILGLCFTTPAALHLRDFTTCWKNMIFQASSTMACHHYLSYNASTKHNVGVAIDPRTASQVPTTPRVDLHLFW